MPGQSAKRLSPSAVSKARLLISEALDLLDARGCTPQAAAHLELALQELAKFIERKG